MKYLKLYESFVNENNSFDVNDINVTDAGPNSYDGGVQKDNVTLVHNGEEYYFDLLTPAGGDGEVHVKYSGCECDENDFTRHFNLVDGSTLDSESALNDFLQVNQPNCEGDSDTIDGFDVEIASFHHDGGFEFGYIEAEINGKPISFDMEQEATAGFDFEVKFADEESERYANEIGLVLTHEVQSYLFDEYDRICADKR